MSDLPSWTSPDVGEILARYEVGPQASPNLALVDKYIAEGNSTALRSLFSVLLFNRNRAEMLSNALLAYIHSEQTKEPRVKEYFAEQMKTLDAGLKAQVGNNKPRAAKSATPKPAKLPAASATPPKTLEW